MKKLIWVLLVLPIFTLSVFAQDETCASNWQVVYNSGSQVLFADISGQTGSAKFEKNIYNLAWTPDESQVIVMDVQHTVYLLSPVYPYDYRLIGRNIELVTTNYDASKMYVLKKAQHGPYRIYKLDSISGTTALLYESEFNEVTSVYYDYTTETLYMAATNLVSNESYVAEYKDGIFDPLSVTHTKVERLRVEGNLFVWLEDGFMKTYNLSDAKDEIRFENERTITESDTFTLKDGVAYSIYSTKRTAIQNNIINNDFTIYLNDVKLDLHSDLVMPCTAQGSNISVSENLIAFDMYVGSDPIVVVLQIMDEQICRIHRIYGASHPAIRYKFYPGRVEQQPT